VKRSLHKSRLIYAIHSGTLIMQSHTNNVFFKLVEALLHIYSCFFSHRIYNYTWLTAIGSVTVSLRADLDN